MATCFSLSQGAHASRTGESAFLAFSDAQYIQQKKACQAGGSADVPGVNECEEMSSVAKAAATKRLGTPWYRCDEIWPFCYGKDKNLPEDKKDVFGYGSVWTWTAIDAETKLMASWMVGTRDAQSAKLFIDDLAGRLSNKVQLTTDGHKPYIEAVADSFGADIDYAMLIKLYDEERQREIRYSPPFVSALVSSRSSERRTASTSALAMWVARTSPCPWGCGGLPD